ncbi:MAG: type II secretion system minor pseudopilin GspI [Neptuniibacter sp.]
MIRQSTKSIGGRGSEPLLVTPKVKGFTLLEVMVALFILSVAAVALINSNSSALRYTDRLQEKMKASWVADNHLSSAHLDSLLIGREGESRFAGQVFYWQVIQNETDEDGFRKITVIVSRDDQHHEQLIRLSSFKGNQ